MRRYERDVTYVNIADMTKDLAFSRFALSPFLDVDVIVHMETNRMDGNAVPLHCPREQADALIALCRQKWHRNHFRFYRNRKRI